MSLKEEADPSLGARIRSGESGAEAELFERFSRPLRLLLLKRTGDFHLAQDLVQETIALAISKIRAGELQHPNALSGFLRAIAINLSIQHYRKESRVISDGGGIIGKLVAPRDEKDRSLDRASAHMAVMQVLDQLTMSRDREVLRRLYLQEEDKAEICASLGLTPTHFDRVHYRARQRVRKLLVSDPDLLRRVMAGLSYG